MTAFDIDVAGVAALLVGGLAIGIVASRMRAVAIPLLVAFALRAAFVFADILFLDLTAYSDGFSWHRGARLAASLGWSGVVESFGGGAQLFKFVMAFLYWLFSPSAMMIQVLNATLGTLVVAVVWLIARELGVSTRRSRLAVWLVVLFPSAIIHSGMLLREAVVTLPITVATLYLVRWARGRGVHSLVVAAVWLLVSISFHSGAFGVVVAVAAWAGFDGALNFVAGRFGRSLRNFAAVLVFAGLAAFLAESGWGLGKFVAVEEGGEEALQQIQQRGAGRTGYTIGGDSPGGLVATLPLRTAFFLFAPFPWMVASGRDLLGLFDGLVFLGLLFLLAREWRGVLRSPALRIGALIFGAMVVVFSMGVSNYGTAFRHRGKLFPLLVPVAFAAAEVTRARRRAAAGALGRRRTWQPAGAHQASPGNAAAVRRASVVPGGRLRPWDRTSAPRSPVPPGSGRGR